MKPMFLAAVENNGGSGPYEAMIEKMKADGVTVPQIFHLIRYKPNVGRYLTQLTQEIMRGPSRSAPG